MPCFGHGGLLREEGVQPLERGSSLPRSFSLSPVPWVVAHLVAVLLLATCTRIPRFSCLYFLIEQPRVFDGKSSSPKKCLRR